MYRFVLRLLGLLYLRPASVPTAHNAAARANSGCGLYAVSVMNVANPASAPFGGRMVVWILSASFKDGADISFFRHGISAAVFFVDGSMVGDGVPFNLLTA